MPRIPRHLHFTPLLLVTTCVLLACNDPVGEDTPYVVVPVTPTALAGTPGWALTDTLVVEVRDAEGHPVPGAKVTWSLPQGGSLAVQLADADNRLTGTADSRGRNYAVWTLGLVEGTQVAKAAAGFEEPASFSATATALHALDVTVGEESACAILTDQRPVCWGRNLFGELGVGDLLDRSMPTPLAGLTAALQIVSSPSFHACARDLVGDVWCWGAQVSGQTGALAESRQVTPVRVPGAEGATTIALGYSFSCAILAVGGARCWGSNDGGRLGIGAPTVGGVTYPIPQAVVGGSGFVRVDVTLDRACALEASGEVWCWGYAWSGELSPAPDAAYYAPVQPIPGFKFSEVGLNWYANCGIAVGGVARCWGNQYGLGRNSPPWETAAPVSPHPDGSFAQIAADQATFYGRTRDGRLLTWGYRLDCCGQQPPFGEVPLPVRIIDVAGGSFGYCVIAESGALYCDNNSLDGRGGLKGFPVSSVP